MEKGFITHRTRHTCTRHAAGCEAQSSHHARSDAPQQGCRERSKQDMQRRAQSTICSRTTGSAAYQWVTPRSLYLCTTSGSGWPISSMRG